VQPKLRYIASAGSLKATTSAESAITLGAGAAAREEVVVARVLAPTRGCDADTKEEDETDYEADYDNGHAHTFAGFLLLRTRAKLHTAGGRPERVIAFIPIRSQLLPPYRSQLWHQQPDPSRNWQW